MSIRFGNLRSRRILYWECGQEGRIRARLQGWRSGWEMRGWWGQVKGYSLKASVAWKERWRLLGVWGQTWVDEDGKALSMLIGWGEEPLWKGKTESTEKREDNWESAREGWKAGSKAREGLTLRSRWVGYYILWNWGTLLFKLNSTGQSL